MNTVECLFKRIEAKQPEFDDQLSKMVDMNSDVKTMDIPINMQRVFNPLVEAATLRLQDTPIGNFNVAIDDVNVSSILNHSHSAILFVIILNNQKTKTN